MTNRLPIVGSDNNNWGSLLNTFLLQSLVDTTLFTYTPNNGSGTLNIAPTNPATGGTNFNLATATYPGIVQLAGDLSNTYSSPQVVSTHLSAALPVNQGGTGQISLTSNNVILGNGTSGVQFVAPGTTGNVLTSNGTTWASSPAAGGGATQRTFAFFAG